jgi:Uma2 family endonuclease
MGLPLKVVSSEGAESVEPYLLRVGGWTEERYFAEAPETRLVEFEDGAIVMHSPAGTMHQQLVRLLTILVGTYVRARDLGDVLNGPAVVRLRPNLDYEPDVFFVPKERLGALGDQYFSGAPALVIEVLSPGTRNHDLKTKATNYARHGVREYWAVDAKDGKLHRHLLPKRSTDRYRVTVHAKGRLDSEVVPGFWLLAEWLWKEPLPPELECLEQILAGRTNAVGRVRSR